MGGALQRLTRSSEWQWNVQHFMNMDELPRRLLSLFSAKHRILSSDLNSTVQLNEKFGLDAPRSFVLIGRSLCQERVDLVNEDD